jgi:hypothetical protein
MAPPKGSLSCASPNPGLPSRTVRHAGPISYRIRAQAPVAGTRHSQIQSCLPLSLCNLWITTASATIAIA